MLSATLSLLITLNPFALFIYLDPIMKTLTFRGFFKLLLRSTLISSGVLIFFFLIGEYLFNTILKIHFESFRIFGGIVIFTFAFLYIIGGRNAMIVMKDDLDELASEIAIPFMVGAGTISVTILISHHLSKLTGIISVLLAVFLDFFIIISLKFIRDKITSKKIKFAFEKNMHILTRITGFFIGSIGVDFIITGIKNIIFS